MSHNEIHDVPHNGIVITGGGRAKGTQVVGNLVERSMGVLMDGGRRPLAIPTLSTETPSGVTRRRLARIATEVLAPWIWGLGLPLIVAWKVTGYHFGETVLIPFAACIGSLAVGFLILIAGNPPHEMIALAAAELACLIAALAITFGWKFKISTSATVAAGATVMLMRVYHPWLALPFIAVAWVCWSRVELGDHTKAEVSTGAAASA